MSDGVVIALLIVFITLCCAGLIVYAVFFAIHKYYFRKEINLIKKYNQLINGLSGINIFKIQVLAKNDIGNKLDLNKYVDIYHKLKNNETGLKANIGIAEAELNAFNLKVAKKYIESIDKDLTKALKDLASLQQAYNNYTQYGDTIESTFQNYLDIYEALTNFYYDKLKYTEGFIQVNNLILSIRKTFESLPKLSNEFNYKTTVDTILDLGKKLKTLADVVISIFKFQMVDVYLLTSKQYNESMIRHCRDEIAHSDLQTLQNLLTIFVHAYNQFNKHYKVLQLGKAQTFAIQAIGAINQVNQFAYVHINTPAWINLSISEIKDQTDRIIANKEDILSSMRDLKQYFVLEPKIIESFNTIEKNVNKINQLNSLANSVNYKTHTEKIRAIKDLDSIGKQIVTNKEQIVQSIDSINMMLTKVVKTVTDLNDLYIYFWQLLAIVKQYVPSGQENNDIQKLIKSNINQLEEYSKQIIANDNPDFDDIAYQISSIIEQSHQIYKRMTTTITLKTYASKLFIYANRYKKVGQLKDDFVAADKLFKAKEYEKCIDQLLKIVKLAKKYKNQK